MTTKIREAVERVKGRHQHRRSTTPVGPPEGYCSRCPSPYPCDAARLAGVVETLVTALGDARAFLDSGFDKMEYDDDFGEYDLAGDHSHDARYAFPSRERWMREHLDTALADAARELEGGSDEGG